MKTSITRALILTTIATLGFLLSDISLGQQRQLTFIPQTFEPGNPYQHVERIDRYNNRVTNYWQAFGAHPQNHSGNMMIPMQDSVPQQPNRWSGFYSNNFNYQYRAPQNSNLQQWGTLFPNAYRAIQSNARNTAQSGRRVIRVRLR